MYKKKTRAKNVDKKNEEIWKYYQQLTSKRHVSFSRVYAVDKGPKTIKYIFLNPRVKSIMEQLYFMRHYQEDLLANIIIYVETFFRLHYNVIIGKYDACRYIPIIKDIQIEILELFGHITFNVPKHSSIIDIPDIDKHIHKKQKELHAITTRYITVLKHKFKNCADIMFAFRPYDPSI
jgi:hypothetical protein